MKISLTPFSGCTEVHIPVPPLAAAIHCHQRGCYQHIGQLSAEPVPFAVFVELGGMSPEEATALVCARRGEIMETARKLLVTPLNLN